MTGLTRSRAFGILVLRIVIGLVFLYAGFEKLLGAEPFSAFGFLTFATAGTAAGAAPDAIVNPTHQFWVDLAGNGSLLGIVNWLVPFGQVAIGVALIAGFATRFAGVMGALMMTLLSVAAWDFAFGPLNHTVVVGIAALVLGIIGAGEIYGVDAVVDTQPIVKRAPLLRYVLG
ncbi:MAG: DoxX family membrane protein [Chloroflexota bacterium]|nr:DoxX family membrane protein [Chloroflexota bacterium]